MIGENRQLLVADEPVEFDEAPIAPNFLFSSSREIAGDYVKKKVMAHQFSHYYSRKCRWCDRPLGTVRCDRPLRDNRLRFKNARKLPIILEKFVEYTPT